MSRYVRQLPASTRTETPGRRPRIADAGGVAPLVLVQADPEAYVLPEVGRRLLASLEAGAGLSLVLPVCNEPWCEEARTAPPFAYSTPTLLGEAAAFVAASAGTLRETDSPASPVFAVRRSTLEALPADLPLDEVPPRARAAGFRAAIDSGAYVHRYGAMDDSARGDLAARVPAGARTVLDVGCSRGASAAALRSRGVEHIVGIEPDPDDAAEAARRYDRVLRHRLEDVAEDFGERFDAILFGDVLEHLEDPTEALARVRPWLAPGGVVVASVPNVGHWSVIDDLLRGRFDYVPYSLLSGTHIRMFTRRTLEDVLEASGYRIRSMETVVLEPPAEGRKRLERLRSLPSSSPDLEVAEFLVVAEAAR